MALSSAAAFLLGRRWSARSRHRPPIEPAIPRAWSRSASCRTTSGG